jgi:hypothetical protein
MKWTRAIFDADDTHDLGAIADLIESDEPLSEGDRHDLADLLRRHQLQDLSGGPRRPFWERYAKEEIVIEAVRAFRKRRRDRPREIETDAFDAVIDHFAQGDDDEFKDKLRDRVERWLNKDGRAYREFKDFE